MMAEAERDDPRMAELLEQFGRSVRAEEGGQRLFVPGDDLSWLDRGTAEGAGDAADASAGGPPRLLRPARMRAVTAAAAVVALLIAMGWWALAGGGSSPDLTGVRLSRTSGVLRGDEAPVFRSGDRIWLHADAGGPGFAFVALLDERDQVAAVTPEAVPLHEGHNVIGPFVLDDQTGTATMILVATRAAHSGSWFSGVLDRARRAAEGAGDHAGRLAAIVKAMRAEKDAAAWTVTYEHSR
jgi:hypothetical protein